MMKLINDLTNSKTLLNQKGNTNLLIEVDANLREELQQTIFSMYLDIADVCKRHNIPVALIGGSALGTIRHNGFIPWDDDIDIGMMRADYQKFVVLFEEELGDKYILSAPNYKHSAKARFPKILKKGTVLEEILDSKDKNLCRVFLDIFILENIPENGLYRKVKGTFCNMLEFISSAVYFYENADEKAKEFYRSASNRSYRMRMVIGWLFSYKNARAWFDRVDRIAQYNKETSLLGIPTGRKHYFGEILKKEELIPYITAHFENADVQLFKNQDYYLTNLYGDYMKIPPVEKREKHFIKKIEL